MIDNIGKEEEEVDETVALLSTPNPQVSTALGGHLSAKVLKDVLEDPPYKEVHSPSLEQGTPGNPDENTPLIEDEKDRISNIFQLLGMTCFGFALSMILLGTSIIVPLFVGRHVTNPAPFLAMVNMVSSGLQIAGLVVSYFSDRCTARFGRRRPFILSGGLTMTVSCVMIMLGINYELIWLFVAGFWILAFAMSIVGQANSALVSDVTARSRMGIVGGMTGLWVAVGGVTGLVLMISVSNLIIVCSIFCACSVITLIIVMFCAKEKQLPEDSEILIPLRSAKGPFQRVWVMMKDFVSSFLFSIKRFPDFFMLLMFRAISTVNMAAGAFSQYYLNDIMKTPDPQTVSSFMSIIVLVSTLVTSPLFGGINDCSKRPRLMMVFGCFISLISISVYIWAPSVDYFYFVQSPLFGLFSGAVSSSTVPVSIDVMPTREKAAQYFAELTLFELISMMVSSAVIGLLIGMYSLSHPTSSSSSSSESSYSTLLPFLKTDSQSSLSSSEHCAPQMYSREGYDIMYSVCLGAQALSLIILLFINTGRGRKAQAEMKKELEKEPLLAEATVSGSVNADS